MGEIPGGKFLEDGRKFFGVRDGIFGKVDEDETFPEREAGREQAVLRLVESGDAIHVWSAGECAIETIGPGVVRALDGMREMPSRIFAKAGASMTAEIVEGADLAGLIAENDEVFAGGIDEVVIAGFGELGLVANAKPFGGEDGALLAGEDFRRGEIISREGFRAGRKGFDGFLERGHLLRLTIRQADEWEQGESSEFYGGGISDIVRRNPCDVMWRELFRRKSVAAILEEAERGKREAGEGKSLRRTLRVRDLAAFGIAAIIGAGIFSTIGQAAYAGGPAVSLLFVLVAVACGFTAFCYAEFASRVPISGSAYTYAYASFGELVAWTIGWDLLLEYAIGNIAIAISWSDYFTALLAGLGLNLPGWMTMDFLTAYRAQEAVSVLVAQGQSLAAILTAHPEWKDGFEAWGGAPVLGPFRLVADLPALFIAVFATWLVYIGVRESRNATNILVAVKLAVILAVIGVGFFYVNPQNWSDFMPNGMTGVLTGVAAVFWAFIGFDALATTAEECENSQRDIPRGIFWALAICTVLYVLISFVLTGIVSYKELNVGDPLAYIFKERLPWFSGVIALSAVLAIGGVFLVFQYGQPRIWMSMSRDGLLPARFSRIHPKYRTPSFATVVTGLMVAVPALFLNLKEVIELSSIGTLFAFVVVCGGVLILDQPEAGAKSFRTPYLNGRYVMPLLYGAGVWVGWKYFQGGTWSAETIPMLFFVLVATVMTVLSVARELSLIPVLGLLSCLYLMTQLGVTNWLRFAVWLLAGLAIYFVYSRKSSRLARERAA